jgi:hypothetical protein
MGLVATPFFDRPKWLIALAAYAGTSADGLLNVICVVIFGGAGFVAGGMYGRFRERLDIENAGVSSEFKMSFWNIAVGVLLAILLLFILGFCCLLPPIRR